MKLPSEQEVSEWCRRLEEIDWNSDKPLSFRNRLHAAMRRNTEAAVVDGYPTSTTSDGRGGSELTSVESAASQLIEGRPLHDELDADVVAALDFLQQCVMSAGAVGNRLRHIAERAVPGKPLAHEEPVCAQHWCEDPAVRRGRCEACSRWEARWSERTERPVTEAPTIPEAQIQERKAERVRRRVRVDGPLAS